MNFSVGVTGKNAEGVAAPSLDVIVVNCPGCNGHGVCNNNTFRDSNSSTDLKYSVCECEPYWEGKNMVATTRVLNIRKWCPLLTSHVNISEIIAFRQTLRHQ